MGEVMSNKFVSPLFYSDLFVKQNVGTDKQRKVLLDKINYLKKNNIKSSDGSNEGCFRTTYEYGEELDFLREIIKHSVIEISGYYADRDETFKMILSQDVQLCDFSIWTNVNEPGSANVIHTHKEFDFACTYNLQTTGTGGLIFKNPANLLSDCSNKSPFTRKVKVEPQDGDLFIWPTWVPHEVEINKSNKQRINIATNVKLVGENK